MTMRERKTFQERKGTRTDTHPIGARGRVKRKSNGQGVRLPAKPGHLEGKSQGRPLVENRPELTELP